MASNTGKNSRKGSVKNRTQMETPNGNYIKRDSTTGKFISGKKDGSKYKGVATEKDDRKS